MAAVTAHWFVKGGKNLVEQEIGWVASAINVALMKEGWVPDHDTPEAWADVSADETTGTAYTAGGVVIANRSVSVDTAANETRLLGDPVQWPGSTILARGAVIYANAGSKPLLGYVDFGFDRGSSNGLFRLEWPVTGVLRLYSS